MQDTSNKDWGIASEKSQRGGGHMRSSQRRIRTGGQQATASLFSYKGLPAPPIREAWYHTRAVSLFPPSHETRRRPSASSRPTVPHADQKSHLHSTGRDRARGGAGDGGRLARARGNRESANLRGSRNSGAIGRGVLFEARLIPRVLDALANALTYAPTTQPRAAVAALQRERAADGIFHQQRAR